MRSSATPTSGSFTRPEGARLRALADVRWGLLLAALALAGIGLATVHSASAELAIDYLPRQAIWVGIGLAACAAAFAVDHRLLLAFAVPLYLLSVLLLLLVLVVGHEAGGAQGWLRVGGVGFQPSELAKLATALLLARMLARVGRGHLTGRDTARALAVVALPMALTAVEPDLGGAVMFLPVVLGMLFVCGLPWRLVAASALLVLVAGGVAWGLFMKPYQKERVLTFLDAGRDPRGAGYQARQSKIAVGSGELTGKGYMQGSQSQLRFLPARHTDFILAVLAEERGFFGVATVLLLYGLFLASGGVVAMRSRDRSGLLLVAGLLAMIGFHVLYNSAMVIGLVPITGIPIPFLSYGGSFMVVCFAATGLILGVDYRRYVNR